MACPPWCGQPLNGFRLEPDRPAKSVDRIVKDLRGRFPHDILKALPRKANRTSHFRMVCRFISHTAGEDAGSRSAGGGESRGGTARWRPCGYGRRGRPRHRSGNGRSPNASGRTTRAVRRAARRGHPGRSRREGAGPGRLTTRTLPPVISAMSRGSDLFPPHAATGPAGCRSDEPPVRAGRSGTGRIAVESLILPRPRSRTSDFALVLPDVSFVLPRIVSGPPAPRGRGRGTPAGPAS
jgi:hypothetical protein